MAKVLTSTENLSYEEWLEWRRKGIGGSDASVVCGINKYRSPIELWLDKTGQAAFEEAGEAAELITQYDAACEKIEALTEQKKEAENLLKEMLGENESGVSDNRIVTWKSISQERLDSKTLKAEHPALYKKYANKTSYRRFSINAAS